MWNTHFDQGIPSPEFPAIDPAPQTPPPDAPEPITPPLSDPKPVDPQSNIY